MNKKPIFIDEGNIQGQTFENADANALKDIFVCSTVDGTRLQAITVTSSDGISHLLEIYFNNGTDFLLGTVLIPANAGTDGIEPPVDILAAIGNLPKDVNDNFWIILKDTQKITMNVKGVVVVNKITVVSIGADY